jgi:anti-sigma regulatory factor (Ser/Thr protein kinase)
MFAGGARPFYNSNLMTPTEARADFPADPSSAAKARRFVEATLHTWSCDALLDAAVLLVSELVSNAVLHAGTPIAVVLSRHDGRLRVEVRDGSERLPVAKHYSALSGTGRGLLLLDRMADQWGSGRDGTGKTVWFELDSSSDADAHGVDAFDLDAFDLDDFQEGVSEGHPGRAGTGGGGGAGGVGPRALVLVGR